MKKWYNIGKLRVFYIKLRENYKNKNVSIKSHSNLGWDIDNPKNKGD